MGTPEGAVEMGERSGGLRGWNEDRRGWQFIPGHFSLFSDVAPRADVVTLDTASVIGWRE
jgi:hypothetical protein